MRIAEFSMALVMAIFSVYLMWKSTELPIGWIDGEGPGGGAFPFAPKTIKFPRKIQLFSPKPAFFALPPLPQFVPQTIQRS